MTYGDGAGNTHPLIELDVAGHEMSHGVTENTAGLNYTGDAGGLNEATVRHLRHRRRVLRQQRQPTPGDYLIGEKIDINGNGTPLRYMDKPSKDGGAQGLLVLQPRQPRPALLLGPAEPLVLPGLRGLGRQDHQRRHRTTARPATAPR